MAVPCGFARAIGSRAYLRMPWLPRWTMPDEGLIPTLGTPRALRTPHGTRRFEPDAGIAL